MGAMILSTPRGCRALGNRAAFGVRAAVTFLKSPAGIETPEEPVTGVGRLDLFVEPASVTHLGRPPAAEQYFEPVQPRLPDSRTVLRRAQRGLCAGTIFDCGPGAQRFSGGGSQGFEGTNG